MKIKKLTAMILAVTACIALAGCGEESSDSKQPESSPSISSSTVETITLTAKEVSDQLNTFFVQMDIDNKSFKGNVTLNIKCENGVWSVTGGNGGEDWRKGEDHYDELKDFLKDVFNAEGIVCDVKVKVDKGRTSVA